MNWTIIIKWLGFLLFVAGFCMQQGWLSIEALNPYHLWIMGIAALIAFIFGNQIKWLGAAVFVFGLALHQGWVNINVENMTFSGIYVMVGGYVTLFFNSR